MSKCVAEIRQVSEMCENFIEIICTDLNWIEWKEFVIEFDWSEMYVEYDRDQETERGVGQGENE